MRTIMCMNAKGGCGKTTIATNLSVWFADEGLQVCLVDFDPQHSSLDWLAAREDYAGVPEIPGIDGTDGPVRAPKGTDIMIMDVPAGTHGKEIDHYLRRTERLLVPVLPSPIDMRAAQRFIAELLGSGRVSRQQTRIGLVANRVRENTRVFHALEDFLRRYDIPLLTALRESQNYIRAADTGLGLFELAPSAVLKDVEQWDAVLEWLDKQ